MKRLFGTDGVRGVAGQFPLDRDTTIRLGRALAILLGRSRDRAAPVRVAIGRDTRESGPQLEAWLSRGIRDAGGRAETMGIVTTPALAFLTREGGFSAGAMISASHNPYSDNGIKVLGPDGMKFPDGREALLEQLVLDGGGDTLDESGQPASADAAPHARPLDRGVAAAPVDGVAAGAVDGAARGPMAGALPKAVAGVADDPPPPLFPEPSPALEAYRRHLIACCGGEGALEGLTIALDCAHGAAARIAPELFRSLGARVSAIGCDPTGRNINSGCGSLHLEPLQQEVLRTGADLGLAFDGDADRCLPVDRTGRALDGDFILWIQARRLRARRRLRGDVVVATVMSNLWLERALAEEGIRLLRAPVGDKYVLERMLAENASLGGEQSGHIIFLDHFPTGDGILTGLLLAAAVRADALKLDELAGGIRRYPQVLLNVRVARKVAFESHPVIAPAVARIESALAGQGRLLLRYSGTEPLARVMVEGADAALVESAAKELAALIQDELGS